MTHPKQIKNVALYCRVSTDDQNCDRQMLDLRAFCERAEYTIVATFIETASGAKNDRIERAKVLKLAQARKIDAVIVTEMSRWGRSTVDLLETLRDLEAKNVSLIAQTGMTFDLGTPAGKLMATVLAGVSEFERDLLTERINSGLAAARAKGKILGRPEGFNPSDKYADKVLKHLADGRSVRWIAKDLQISTTTVQKIKKRA